jgi:ABC-2 type transport system permease protein
MSTSPAATGGTSPTRAETPFNPAKHLRDFWWLLRGELFLLREAWFWYLVQVSFVPLVQLVFLWLLVGRRDPAAMAFFLTGSLVMSLSLGGMLSLGQHLGGLKEAHAFEYYAALPIAKPVFVAAITTRGTLLALPSALLILLLGWMLYGLVVPPRGLPILLLAAYAMAGFGAAIGFWSPTAQIASLATQVLQTLIIFLGPIYYPPATLPAPLRATAYLWPTTYAAEALRGAVAGDPWGALWPPVAVLVGFVGLSLALVPLKLEWRSR